MTEHNSTTLTKPGSFFCMLSVSLVSALLYLALSLYLFPPLVASKLLLWTDATGVLELHYSDSDTHETADFYRGDAVSIRAQASIPANSLSSSAPMHSFQLPAVPISTLRIKVADAPGLVHITKACLQRGDGKQLCWDASLLATQFEPRQDIAAVKLTAHSTGHSTGQSIGKRYTIRSVGAYPYIQSHPSISSHIRGFLRGSYRKAAGLFVGLCVLHCFLVFLPIYVRKTVYRGYAVRVIFLVAPLGAFLWFANHFASHTPAFMGPDEAHHVSKLLSEVLSPTEVVADLRCGELPPSVLREVERVRSLYQFSSEPRPALMHPAAGSQQTFANACAYSKLYLYPAAWSFQFLGNKEVATGLKGIDAEEMLTQFRRGVVWSSALGWAVVLALALFGRIRGWGRLLCHAAWQESLLRVVLVASTTYCMLLPLTVWLSAVLNQEYLLIVSASALLVSLFFYLPVISELILILAIAAAASKIVYVPVFLLLAFGAFAAKPIFSFCKQMSRWRGLYQIACIVVLVLLGVTSYLAFWNTTDYFCRRYNCYGIWSASIFHSLPDFLADLHVLLFELRTMLFPPWSFDAAGYRLLAWLDLGIPSYQLRGLAVLPWTAVLLSIVLLIVYRRRPCCVSARFVAAAGAWVAVYVVAVLSVYGIAALMHAWCGIDQEFGCGYQRRYDLIYLHLMILPLYLAPIFLVPTQILERMRGGDTLLLKSLFVLMVLLHLLLSVTALQQTLGLLERSYGLG